MSKDKRSKKGPVLPKKLTERGIHLERAHQAQQGSSRNFGQKVVVGKSTNGEEIAVNIGQRCPKCKKRVRGFNHVNGAHHNGTVHKHSR